MLYMVTFTINIPQMLAYIPAPWILWEWSKPMVSGQNRFSRENHPQVQRRAQLDHRRGAGADH